MKFEITTNPLHRVSADAAVVFSFKETDKKKKQTYITTKGFRAIDAVLKGQLSKLAEAENYKASRGEVIALFPQSGIIVPTKVYVIGLGAQQEFGIDDLRRAVGSFAQKMKKKIDSIAVALPDDHNVLKNTELVAKTISESVLLGSYAFAQYKTKEKGERTLATAIIANVSKNSSSAQKGIEEGELYARATILARDLVNEQAAYATPTHLTNIAKDIAKASPHITCRIIDKDEAEKMGMHAFLGIARASDTPPKFIHLTYTPAGKKVSHEKIALVGKGITFDSGGINVKPGDHMQEMKMDMSGAAAVLGVFSVIEQLQPKVCVVGLIAATPNLISSKSIVPGDVVKALNGKTIEVLNTDAEGRVTLADSLSYAVKQKATKIVDLATLTGACVVALGSDIAGLMTNNKAFGEKLKNAADQAGEKVWELPLDKDYVSLNKSDVADIANIPNTRYGGTITAGLFLEEFVDKTPWIHLDIAGPAFYTKPVDICPKGGSGFGVRLLLNLITKQL